jgi:hypothetical protein
MKMKEIWSRVGMVQWVARHWSWIHIHIWVLLEPKMAQCPSPREIVAGFYLDRHHTTPPPTQGSKHQSQYYMMKMTKGHYKLKIHVPCMCRKATVNPTTPLSHSKAIVTNISFSDSCFRKSIWVYFAN